MLRSVFDVLKSREDIATDVTVSTCPMPETTGWSWKAHRWAILRYGIGLASGFFLLYGGWLIVGAIFLVIFDILREQTPPLVSILIGITLAAAVACIAFLVWLIIRRRAPPGRRAGALMLVAALPLVGAASAPLIQEHRLRVGLRLVAPDVPHERVVAWEDRKLHLDSSFGPWIAARFFAPADREQVLAIYGRTLEADHWKTCYRPEIEAVPTCWKKGSRSFRISDLTERDDGAYWVVRYAPAF